MAEYWTSCRRMTNRKINLPVNSLCCRLKIPIANFCLFFSYSVNLIFQKQSGYIYSILYINKSILSTLINYSNTKNVMG